MSLDVNYGMILAAGLGTRMRPLYTDRPKPLVQVGGQTLLDHALNRLEDANVNCVVVNVHYKADMIRRHLTNRKTPHIIISDETDCLLDTGGGVKNALPLLGTAPFFTHNSDALWIENTSALTAMKDAWDDRKMDALMLLAPMTHCTGFDGAGDFFMDAHSQLTRRGDHPSAPFAWAGVQLIHPRAFSNVPDGPFSTNVIWDKLITQKRLYGISLDGTWMHVGSPEGFQQADTLLRDRQIVDSR